MIYQKITTNKGVTLIELMIVLVIAGILVGGIYTLFATQQRSYYVQDRVTGIQQDGRAVLNIMARDIRMAGFVTGAGSASGFSDDSAPFSLSSDPAGDTFTYAIEPENSNTASDTLTVVLGVEELGVVDTTSGNLVTFANLDTNTPFATAVTNDVAFVAFDLQVGKLYKVSSVDFSNDEITIVNFSSGEKIVGGKAYWVKAVTYSVNSGVLRRNENLGAGAESLAGDPNGETTVVEDLQFAYQVAGDAGWYNDPATDFPAGSSQANIEMVRINVTVRTAVADATVQDEVATAQFNQPALEDHTNPADLNGPDGFRRRVYTTVVKARNL
jgi:prepilin-type N-terminal cleavage/methylation domain-containing protein